MVFWALCSLFYLNVHVKCQDEYTDDCVKRDNKIAALLFGLMSFVCLLEHYPMFFTRGSEDGYLRYFPRHQAHLRSIQIFFVRLLLLWFVFFTYYFYASAGCETLCSGSGRIIC